MSQVSESEFKVLLSHDPTHWENEVKMHPQHIHLTLSGHTHGMQMGIEIPGFKWSLSIPIPEMGRPLPGSRPQLVHQQRLWGIRI